MAEPDWTLGVVTGVLVAAVILLAWYGLDPSWGVALATVALVSATLILGRHTRGLTMQTKSLAEATKDLARIEERKDTRSRLEKAVQAAESVRDIDMDQYISMLEEGQVHEGFAQRVFELAKYLDLISGEETRKALTQWRNWLDSHKGTTGWHIGDQGDRMGKEYEVLQERLEGEITTWRERIVAL